MSNIGDQVLWMQFAPSVSNVGTQTASMQPSALVPLALDSSLVFADFAKRLANLEWQQKAAGIGKDGILSQIALSKEAVLISSSKIGIAGQVTFSNWLRGISGAVSVGTGATVNITTSGGIVTVATINSPGIKYSIGDQLVVSGANSNCVVTVATLIGSGISTLTISSGGTGYSNATGVALLSGALDPSITQISGGMITTDCIYSQDGNSFINLEASGAQNFIYAGGSTPTIQVSASGHFTFGASGAGQLAWDGANLSINGSALLNGTATSTVVLNAANGNTAYNNYSTAGTMSKTLQNILSGAGEVLYIAGGGSIGWSGGVPSLSGGATSAVTISANGIAGLNSSGNGFYVSTSGNAGFTGNILASSGNFTGKTSSVSGTIGGYSLTASLYGQSSIATSGYIDGAIIGYNSNTSSTGYGHCGIAGIVADNSSTLKASNIGVYGYSGYGTGVYGQADQSGGNGVVGKSSSTGAGVYAVNSSSGAALTTSGPSTFGGNVTLSSGYTFSVSSASASTYAGSFASASSGYSALYATNSGGSYALSTGAGAVYFAGNVTHNGTTTLTGAVTLNNNLTASAGYSISATQSGTNLAISGSSTSTTINQGAGVYAYNGNSTGAALNVTGNICWQGITLLSPISGSSITSTLLPPGAGTSLKWIPIFIGTTPTWIACVQ